MIVTKNQSEFSRQAKSWALEVAAANSGLQIILLSGPMGAGKTLWVRECVEALGGKWVSSPSFAIIQRYRTPSILIDHVDLFRLKDERDLESTGFWDLLDSRSGWIFIEWADRLSENLWPRRTSIWRIQIDVDERKPEERRLHLNSYSK
jgi:tRNA threonylcarbamoyladenosine biosynthesis protein TsaE